MQDDYYSKINIYKSASKKEETFNNILINREQLYYQPDEYFFSIVTEKIEKNIINRIQDFLFDIEGLQGKEVYNILFSLYFTVSLLLKSLPPKNKQILDFLTALNLKTNNIIDKKKIAKEYVEKYNNKNIHFKCSLFKTQEKDKTKRQEKIAKTFYWVFEIYKLKSELLAKVKKYNQIKNNLTQENINEIKEYIKNQKNKINEIFNFIFVLNFKKNILTSFFIQFKLFATQNVLLFNSRLKNKLKDIIALVDLRIKYMNLTAGCFIRQIGTNTRRLSRNFKADLSEIFSHLYCALIMALDGFEARNGTLTNYILGVARNFELSFTANNKKEKEKYNTFDFQEVKTDSEDNSEKKNYYIKRYIKKEEPITLLDFMVNYTGLSYEEIKELLMDNEKVFKNILKHKNLLERI